MNRACRVATATAKVVNPTKSIYRPISTSSIASSSTQTIPSNADSSNRPLSRGTRMYSPSQDRISTHLNSLLEPLQCPLATGETITAVTLKSGLQKSSDSNGHNVKMSFIGRRVLRMHLTLFLSHSLASSPPLLSKFLSQTAIDRILETKELGAGAGRAWKLEDVMRWREVNGPDGLPTGLFKARGTTLEAILGAVYLAHGIKASSRVFSTSILPHLNLPPNCNEAVTEAARSAMAEIFSETTSSEPPSDSKSTTITQESVKKPEETKIKNIPSRPSVEQDEDGANLFGSEPSSSESFNKYGHVMDRIWNAGLLGGTGVEGNGRGSDEDKMGGNHEPLQMPTSPASSLLQSIQSRVDATPSVPAQSQHGVDPPVPHLGEEEIKMSTQWLRRNDV